LTRFLEIYPETTIPIDGVLMMFLKTIQSAEPSNNSRFSTVVPKMYLPSVQEPLNAVDNHLLQDDRQYTQTDWIGLHRVINSMGKNVLFTTITYNMVSDLDTPAPLAVPIHDTGNNGNSRTQQLQLRPGFTFTHIHNNDGNAAQWRPAIQRMSKRLRVPKIDYTRDFTNFEQLIGFDLDPQFFGRLRTFLKPRFRYLIECKKLSDVPVGTSSHILYETRLPPLVDDNVYNHWFTQDRAVPAAIRAVANWPTQGQPAAPVANASYEFMLQHIPAGQATLIPITELAAFSVDNNLFELTPTVQALSCEEDLSPEQGMEVLAMRTFAPSMVPAAWQPALANVSMSDGPYFETTNHNWLETPTIATSQNVLNVFDDAYRTGRGEDPFPINA